MTDSAIDRNIKYRRNVEQILQAVQEDLAHRLSLHDGTKDLLISLLRKDSSYLQWWIDSVCRCPTVWGDLFPPAEKEPDWPAERVDRVLTRLLGVSLIPLNERTREFFYAGIYHPLLTTHDDRDGIMDVVHVPQGEGSVGYTADIGFEARTVPSTLRELRGQVSIEDIIGGNISVLMAPLRELRDGKDKLRAVLFCFFPAEDFFPAHGTLAESIRELFTRVAKAHQVALVAELENAGLNEAFARINGFLGGSGDPWRAGGLTRATVDLITREHTTALRSLVLDRSEHDPVGAAIAMSFVVENTALRPTAIRISPRHFAARVRDSTVGAWFTRQLPLSELSHALSQQVPGLSTEQIDTWTNRITPLWTRETEAIAPKTLPFITAEPLFPGPGGEVSIEPEVPTCVCLFHLGSRETQRAILRFDGLEAERSLVFEPVLWLARERQKSERRLFEVIVPEIMSQVGRPLWSETMEMALKTEVHKQITASKRFEDTIYSMMGLMGRILAATSDDSVDLYTRQIQVLLEAAHGPFAARSADAFDFYMETPVEDARTVVAGLRRIGTHAAALAKNNGASVVAVSAFFETPTRPSLFAAPVDPALPHELRALLGHPQMALLARVTHLLSSFATDDWRDRPEGVVVSLGATESQERHGSIAGRMLQGLGNEFATLATGESRSVQYRLTEVEPHRSGRRLLKATFMDEQNRWGPAEVQWLLGPSYIPAPVAVNERGLNDYCSQICREQTALPISSTAEDVAGEVRRWLSTAKKDPAADLFRTISNTDAEHGYPPVIQHLRPETGGRENPSGEVFVFGLSAAPSEPGKILLRSFENHRLSVLNAAAQASARERMGMGIGMFHNLGHYTAPLQSEAAVLIEEFSKTANRDALLELMTRNISRVAISLSKFQQTVFNAMLPDREWDHALADIRSPIEPILVEALRPCYLGISAAISGWERRQNADDFGNSILIGLLGCNSRMGVVTGRLLEDPTLQIGKTTRACLQSKAATLNLPRLTPETTLDTMLADLVRIGIEVRFVDKTLGLVIPDLLGVLGLEEVLRNALLGAAVALLRCKAPFRIAIEATPSSVAVTNPCAPEYEAALAKPFVEPTGREGWGRYATYVTLQQYGIHLSTKYVQDSASESVFGQAIARLSW